MGDLAAPVKSIPAAIGRIPENVLHLDPHVFLIGGISLALLLLLSNRKERWATCIPPPLLVVGLGIITGWLLQLQPGYLIHVPDNVLEQGIRPPDFLGVWERPDLWMSVLVLVVTLTLIDGTESLATIAAIDKIDPYRRRSDPNRTLQAMGVSNMLSSMAGGLTIIPGGMKSSTNIYAGGRTLWANAYYAVFLLLFLWVGTELINRIPRAALAAVLIYVGWRLCEPRVFRRILSVGKDQLLIFAVTIAVTLLYTDLLIGIAAGMLTKVVLLCFHLIRSSLKHLPVSRPSLKQAAGLLSGVLAELFSSPIILVDIGDGSGVRLHRNGASATETMKRGLTGKVHGCCSLHLSSITCTNLIKLDEAISKIPPGCHATIVVNVSGRIMQAGHSCRIVGVEKFHAFSDHALSTRLNPQPAQALA